MQIDSVKLSSDIFRGLLSHSFLTEHEEVLGLLYGNYEANEVRIWGSINLIRNCKERDRVEVDELQLSEAMQKSEDLSQSLHQTTLLVGWFHSHPNITIFPSRVDLNTQKSLQSLGQHFIGLIISCFSRDTNNLEKINLIAFQTGDNGKGVSVPVMIVPSDSLLNDAKLISDFDSYDYLKQVHYNLIHEEREKYTKSLAGCNYLGQVFNSSLFNLAITKILEKSFAPMIEFLKIKNLADGERLRMLRAENEELRKKIEEKGC